MGDGDRGIEWREEKSHGDVDRRMERWKEPDHMDDKTAREVIIDRDGNGWPLGTSRREKGEPEAAWELGGRCGS